MLEIFRIFMLLALPTSLHGAERGKFRLSPSEVRRPEVMHPLALGVADSATFSAKPKPPGEDVSVAGEDLLQMDYTHVLVFAGIFLLAGITVVASCWLYTWTQHRNMSADKLQRYASRLGIRSSILTEPGKSIVQEPDGQEPQWGMAEILCDKMNILLIFVPFGLAAHYFHWGATTSFVLNLFAMLPLANLMGVATEELACHTGQTIGGLLNATFGNAVELIVVYKSIQQGLLTVTKGTILGSILANELLVLGMALFFGGLCEKDSPGTLAMNKQQSFSHLGAMMQAQLLLFSAFSICMPSMFNYEEHVSAEHVVKLSRLASIFTLLAYVVFLVFQLYTHRVSFAGDSGEEDEETASVTAAQACMLLVVSTIVVATSSECLVHAIEGFTAASGFSQTFVGVVLIPIIGNACEHATSVVVALKDKITLSIGIALGSSIQIALFVCPFAVIVGWVLDKPMDLNFHRVNAWSLVLSALLVICVLNTGKSNWLNGFVLIVAYMILAVLYFFSPDDALA